MKTQLKSYLLTKPGIQEALTLAFSYFMGFSFKSFFVDVLDTKADFWAFFVKGWFCWKALVQYKQSAEFSETL